jgi:hypothetical protein
MSSIANVVATVAQIALQNPRLDLIRDLETDWKRTHKRSIGSGIIRPNFGQADVWCLVICRGTGYDRRGEFGMSPICGVQCIRLTHID